MHAVSSPVDLVNPSRALDPVRRRIAGSVHRILGGDTDGPPAIDVASDADPGLFGPESVAWTVHADLSMLIGGIRALLLQTLHPLAMAGVAEFSDYRVDALGRLRRTGAFLARTVYGTTAEAHAAVAEVTGIHARVRGTAPDGRSYSALDPHLLAWVHLTEVQSFLVSNQRYGRVHLSPADADRYVAELAQVGLLLGMTSAPMSRSELDSQLNGYRPELHVGVHAREAQRFLLWPPLPLVARGPYTLLFGAATGLLPRWARRMLRLPMAPGAGPLVVRPAASMLLRTLGWALGDPVNRSAAERRIAAARG